MYLSRAYVLSLMHLFECMCACDHTRLHQYMCGLPFSISKQFSSLTMSDKEIDNFLKAIKELKKEHPEDQHHAFKKETGPPQERGHDWASNR